MKTVWKYPLKIAGEQTISVPNDAEPLSVGITEGRLCLWMLVESEPPKVDRKVQVRGTGREIDFSEEQFEFVGTVIVPNGLVWHVWVEVGG